MNHELGQIGFLSGGGPETGAPLRGSTNRLNYRREGVAENHWTPGAKVVEIAIAIGIP